jgi:hypothetical protein
MNTILPWIIVAMTLTSSVLIMNFRREGWLVGFCASFLGMTHFTLTNQIAMCTLNAIYVIINVHGYLKWKKIK